MRCDCHSWGAHTGVGRDVLFEGFIHPCTVQLEACSRHGLMATYGLTPASHCMLRSLHSGQVCERAVCDGSVHDAL